MSVSLLNLIQSAPVVRTAEGWGATPSGQYIVGKELQKIGEMTEDAFGYFALQLGDPHRDLLSASPIPGRFRVGRAKTCDVQASHHQLPFASASADLIVICHVLEFCLHPEAVVRESFRVLRPEGRLLVVGFNSVGPYGFKQRLGLSGAYPYYGSFVPLRRLCDWLAVLGMSVGQGCYLGYTPPWHSGASAWWADVWESAGDRWWPMLGGVYLLQGVKRVQAMRRVTPKWRAARRGLRAPLTVVARVAQQ